MFKDKQRDTIAKIQQTCPSCHRPISLRKGTMTAWLFKESYCNCLVRPNQTFEQSSVQAASSEDEPLPDLGQAYEVIARIGQGGMGAVYTVKDKALGKTFAAKVLKADLTRDKAAIKRFQQEVTAARSLTHPNLAAVYGSFSAPDGTPYFVMDYLDGQSLADVLRNEIYLDVPKALDMFIDLADALEHAHAKGVIHRDLKPSNMILTKSENGQVLAKIVDFGIAAIMPADGATATRLTQTGEIFGSPAYMSPEQCKGEKLDVRSDIYSLGCVMYETLTGKAPFADENAIKTILNQLTQIPKSLRKEFPNLDIPPGVDSVVLHCLEKDPADRYQSMAELRRDLELLRDGKTPIRCTPSPKRRVRRMATGMRWVVVGSALVTVPVLAFIGYNFFSQMNLPSWQLLNQHGVSLLSVRNVEGAKSDFRAALLQAEAAHAPDIDIENICFHVAEVDEDTGSYSRALPVLERTLALSRKHEVNLQRAGTLEMLSRCDRHLGNVQRAIQEATEAVAITRQLYGSTGQPIANALGFLADAYASAKQFPAAAQANQEQIDMDLKLHPDKQYEQIAGSYFTRAFIMSAQGDSKKAIDAAKASLALYQDIEDKDGPYTQRVAAWLTKFLAESGKPEEAQVIAHDFKIEMNAGKKKSEEPQD